MPIPFRDQEEIEDLGTAAFLRVESIREPVGLRGALFQINARGEPMEFTYNRVETPNTFLWRPADIRRAAVRKLTTSLLALCTRIPRLLLCRAIEVPSEVFGQDIAVNLPVCRVAASLQEATATQLEAAEVLEGPEPLHLFWYPAAPMEGSPERGLVQRLILQGLLLEPFQRASVGLDELYGVRNPAAP